MGDDVAGPAGRGGVRPATAEDAEALARLRWQWRVEEAGEQPAEPFDAFARALARWADEHRHGHLAWVAEVDGVAVGMGWLAILERVPGPEVWDRRSGFIQSLYVDPAYRGAGLGLALIEGLLADARGRGLQYVSVHPSPASFPLYRRAGFLDTDRVLQLRF